MARTPTIIRTGWHWEDGMLFDGKGQFIVSAYAEDGSRMPDGTGTEQLLETAPELLEALKARHGNCPCAQPGYTGTPCTAAEVIAKAEGR